MPGSETVIDAGRPGSVSRYFDVSLFALILTGFVTLVSTGKLDLLWTAIVSLGLFYRALLLVQNKTRYISERWVSYFSMAYIPFYALDYFVISSSFLTATVHMVLFSMLLKIFSAQRDRDQIYLSVLSFLMVLSAALLTVDIVFLAAFVLFMLLAVTTFMSMEMKRSVGTASRTVGRFESKMLGKSLSLFGLGVVVSIFAGAGLMFFVLPRVSAGYLTAFSPRNDLVTGFSENVRLGDIGQIKQSSTVVMHIQFTDRHSPSGDLKWRGVALGTFDGRRWYNPTGNVFIANYPNGHLFVGPYARAQQALAESLGRGQPIKPPTGAAPSMISYRVVMEPISTNVFFLATDPFELIGNYREVALDQAESVFNNNRERPITVYQGRSTLPSREKRVVPSFDREDDAAPPAYLQLPATDARIGDLARKVTNRSATDYDRAAAVEMYLRSNYGYTLQLPSAQVKDPLADFLFERKKGHCEYFASAMAIMLRTIGIPSRVVNGFRNGQYNDLTGSYIVRASDAHSWVEAFIQDYGWVTFDPTPPDPLHETNGWSRIMLYADAGREFWREWIINYDYRRRDTLSQKTTGGSRHLLNRTLVWLKSFYKTMVSITHDAQESVATSSWAVKTNKLSILSIVLAGFLCSMVLWFWHRKKSAAKRDADPKLAASLWYRRMTMKAAQSGWNKSPSQTPQEFILTIDQPDMRAAVESFTRHYERARFAQSKEDADALPHLYEEIGAGK